MATVIEKIKVSLTAEHMEAIEHLEEADRHLQETKTHMKDAAEETESWWKRNRMTMAAIAATTAGMMYAIMKASPSMTIAMSEIRWQFQYMAYTVGEATAPVLRAFIPLITAMAEAFADLPEGIQMVVGLIIMATMVTNSMTLAMGPWGLAILAIAVAIAVLAIAWKENWGGIQEKTEAVWEVVEPIFNLFKLQFEIMADALAIFVAIWEGDWDTVKKKIREIVDSIVGVFEELVGGMYDVGKAVIQKWWEGYKAVWLAIWGAVKDIPDAVEDWFVYLVNYAYNWGRNFLLEYWEGMKSVKDDIIDWVEDLAEDIMDRLKFWSPAKKGPFSEPIRFDRYIEYSLEHHPVDMGKVKEYIEPLRMGLAGAGGRGGKPVSPVSNVVHVHQTINVQGYAGSAMELGAVMGRANETMLERIRRRVG